MHIEQARRYLYTASAVPATGEITFPFQQYIDAKASSALPATGGRATARIDDYHVDKIISIGSAVTQLVGSFSKEENAFNTLVTTTIDGLNLLDVVTADRCVARLTSRHLKEDPNKESPGPEASIVFLGCHFENLRIAGFQAVIEYNEDLLANVDTFEGMRAHCPKNKIPSTESRGMLSTSIIKNISGLVGVKVQGNRIEIPQFGVVYLGEVIAKPSTRRLTMIRAELGCSLYGNVSICQIDGNGTEYP